MANATSWLTTAATTTDPTRVSMGKTAFLTITALSGSADAEREIPSWIAIQGRRPAIRNSGKLAKPRSTGTLRITEKTAVYRTIHRIGFTNTQATPRPDPAYRDRVSRTTISLSGKSLAESRRVSLDISRRGGIIVARPYG